jgi:clan AA aspartic protease
MKHIESGFKAGLGMESNMLTFINMDLVNEEANISKTIRFMVDTGFNGYLQLSKSDIEVLKLNVTGESETTIADGTVVKTGITTTKIKILEEEIVNLPIQFIENAPSLIGAALLRHTGRMLILDYEDGYVTLTKDKKIKQAIKMLVDELAVEQEITT